MLSMDFFLGGRWVSSKDKIEVLYPYTNEPVALVSKASVDDAKEAIEIAFEAKEEVAKLTAFERYEILSRTASLLKSRADDFARTLVLEVGKTIKEARTEVARAIQTLTFSAEEAKRINGEVFPIDAHPNGRGKFGFYYKEPAGIVVAITPFNFPLNLSLHKLAPAFAAGNPVILKPSERTPLTPLMLAELFLEAGLPSRALSVLPGDADLGKALTESDLVRVVSFTGSKKVGQMISRQVGIKRLVLELGSNSALIVHKDANLQKALKSAILGAYSIAGQVCISIQRLLIHEEIFDEFLNMLQSKVSELRLGDPMSESTDVGPVIALSERDRILSWIKEASSEGAKVLKGGHAEGCVISPTIITDVPETSPLMCEEAFAPLVVTIPYKDPDEAIRIVNSSSYGLQAGVFTNDLSLAWHFIKNLKCGGVL
ncbi:MAG: aldehyde dehydrogenase family protein, partial [Aquificaceae bacterium]|nr:aldehyde dehydrogenase family protein [Aquificaceae bacterium]